MRLRVIDRNRRHVKVSVFVSGALNGTLTLLPSEWRVLQTILNAAQKEHKLVDGTVIIEKLNQPRCEVCERRKKPLGRDQASAMNGSLCDCDCEGYMQDPEPGTEWD
jgi:hypothetical protein